MSIEFRYPQRMEYPRIQEFLHQYWKPNHVYVRMPELFDWSFGAQHFLVNEGYHVILAEDKGDIIGFLGGIPFELNVFGTTKKGVWLANYIVKQDYRRGSLGLQLLNGFRKSHDAVIAFGVNPSVMPIYQMLKADVLTSVPRHLTILPHARERMHRLLTHAQPDWSPERVDAVIHVFSPPHVSARTVSLMNHLPEDWDQKGWSVLASRMVGCVRDTKYLRWRYLNHPCFRYRIFAVQKGDQIGLGIWRLETIQLGGQVGSHGLDTFGRLVEFLAPSMDIATQLWDAYLAQLGEADAVGTDYYGFHGETGEWLNKLGFLSVDRHPDGQALPSRFQPLDGRGGNLISAVFLNTNLPKCQMGSGCVWYWTKSDADQDRPN